MKYIQTYNLFESKSFDSWFSGSKVVDDFGNPLVVYHGSIYEITELYGGMYFTEDYMIADGYAGGEYVYEAYLSIKEPLVLDCGGNKWDELESVYGSSTQEVVSNLDTDKYDGVIFNNIKDSWIDDVDYQEPSTIYYCISSSQIWSTEL
jgi:hypothetical protein